MTLIAVTPCHLYHSLYLADTLCLSPSLSVILRHFPSLSANTRLSFSLTLSLSLSLSLRFSSNRYIILISSCGHFVVFLCFVFLSLFPDEIV